MERIEGNLVELAEEGRFDVIVHGCNCFHEMGAGIAKPIAARFPEALDADRQTEHGARDKLGTISVGRVVRSDVALSVVNAYTQFHWKGRGPLVDYDAVTGCFAAVAGRFPEARIGYPMIGAGMAGGDWDEIARRIDAELSGLSHWLVVLPGD
ncbi:hypothetical protein [Tranquillimonas rosea]|uniref:hypothetical protein n=1 Tax=Tranquillimonas rosea TaxID=641238 RepID=UPI003BAA01CF